MSIRVLQPRDDYSLLNMLHVSLSNVEPGLGLLDSQAWLDSDPSRWSFAVKYIVTRP